jgi:endonuclease/exonuclease/phosphatase family metal-dependent hydrolase
MKTFSIFATAYLLLCFINLSCKKDSAIYSKGKEVLGLSKSALSTKQDVQGINILSFNILAPCWADPSYYPASSAPFLERVSRRQTIIDLLNSYENKVDVIALQEVAQIEFNYIAQALQSTFVGFQANHASTYWSNWVTATTPWELNGNAIFIKKERFDDISFEDYTASASGNHAALFTGKLKNEGDKQVRIASIHLDSDHAYNRKRELQAVLAKWLPLKNAMDIIAGDFNTETDATNIHTDIRKAGYYDVLEVLGKARQTHPWDTKYYGSDNWGIIDHIISRNSIPIEGAVIDFQLFDSYPKDEEMRINKNLQLSGSDHFPIFGSVGQ